MTGNVIKLPFASAPPFEPRAWLAAYVAAGGAYVLTAHGAPIFIIADADREFFDGMMKDIVGRLDRLAAMRAVMEAGQ